MIKLRQKVIERHILSLFKAMGVLRCSIFHFFPKTGAIPYLSDADKISFTNMD
jgi:hypothetical protein